MHPFTVSNLRALSIRAGPAIQWTDLGPAMNTLEILDINSESHHINFDLTAFPNLHLLRIRVTPDHLIAPDRETALLSSIAKAPHLRTVILQLHCGERQLSAICAAFDQPLSTLRGITVEIVFAWRQKAPLAALFPRLGAKNMLSGSPFNWDWWDETVSRL
ncbi:hypothetical protein C8R47DRAFT_358945 [Mycena vitilis]|nr:hypothetical protein C8R47DRAFT_358945 [Mycena vitilis]